ncbi:bacillithiol biosynthesis cysteine-adding enzyme BshC [Longimicrobium sp.]|uniref:bacillithiol biosynthesis cysteine-adding enzyme BshC n=1 Tax=Longimicrobium sp. TaxID=2029185 RepID=UPI002E323184|nr:bacillithiol biosynthesis cysteine-adding enzyme BshC [Longimicrobium sp.]HEX6038448.1 bacillithiol biosynthesis cysteine-adding enzyme BshC [Longimicrobium sp.]
MDDYRAGLPRAARFFAGNPDDLDAFRVKLDEVRRRFGRAERERAAAAVRPTSASAAARLARFVEEGGAMVTTGQQAGLFTGPLYTVHKILTAIRLAAALEEALGIIVLPVFWSASEDHDFAEANHADVVDGAGKLRRLSVAATDSRPLPMSEMRLGADASDVSGELRELLCSLGSTADHLRGFLEPYQPGRTVAEAFRETIERLFAGFDLLVTEASDPHVKQGSLAVLRGAVEDAAEHERLIRERTEEMEAAGYAAPVTVMPDAANVFFHGPEGRERLARAGDGWTVPGARMRFSTEEIAARMQADPAAFSPNVFLRPVVESAVFPTLAYVGGPAETAYFAQIGPLFRAYGIRPPVAYPRLSVRLVPDEVAEKARALALTDEELRLPEHELVSLVARRRLPAHVNERLHALRATLVDGFGELMDAGMEIDFNLDVALGARRNRALLEVAEAERKILAHFKKADPGIARDLPLVRNHLAPGGTPQERVLNVLPYLALQPTLLHDIAERMRISLSRGSAEPPPVPDGALHAPARPQPAGISPDSIS